MTSMLHLTKYQQAEILNDSIFKNTIFPILLTSCSIMFSEDIAIKKVHFQCSDASLCFISGTLEVAIVISFDRFLAITKNIIEISLQF